MRSSFLISRGRHLHIVTQAESIADYGELRGNLKGVGRGSYIIELIDAVTYEEGSNLKLYELLVDTLELLNNGEDPGIVIRYFELETLSLVGFRPELFSCVECGKVIVEQDQFLSGEMGGVVCPDCARELSQSRLRPITSRNLKYLRHFQRSNIRDVLRLTIPAEVKGDLEKSLQYYFAHTLERHLNSPEFIKLIENNQ
jgi:DNA repair protein RecO (recombination protein O)